MGSLVFGSGGDDDDDDYDHDDHAVATVSHHHVYIVPYFAHGHTGIIAYTS